MKPELRQFGTLTEADFKRVPVWIGVHTVDYEEPWYDETDEQTFRPWSKEYPVDPSTGMFLVHASLTLGDGTQFPGFLTPSPGSGEVRDEDLGTVQPHLFLPDGVVLTFWGGISGFPQEAKDSVYKSLGRNRHPVFPVRFEAQPGLCKGKQVGVIRGFARLLDIRTGTIEVSQ